MVYKAWKGISGPHFHQVVEPFPNGCSSVLGHCVMPHELTENGGCWVDEVLIRRLYGCPTNEGKRGSRDCGTTSKSIPHGVQCGKVCTGVVLMQSDEDMRSTKCVQLCTRVYNSRSLQITRRVRRRS